MTTPKLQCTDRPFSFQSRFPCRVFSPVSWATLSGSAALLSAQQAVSSADTEHEVGTEDALGSTQTVPVLTQALPVHGLSSGIDQVKMDLAASVLIPNHVVPSGPSASAVTTDARQLAQSVSAFIRQKGGELIGGPGTSDASIGPIGPPSHNQSPPLEHVDGLARGLAGVSHHMHYHPAVGLIRSMAKPTG